MCKQGSKAETAETKPLKPAHLVGAYLCFNGLILVVIGVCLGLLVGAYYHPKWVGGCVLLPYYSYVLFLGRHETNDGAHWTFFSKNFPLFCFMRRFLRMKFVSPKELTDADKLKDAQFLLAVFPHGTNADFRILMDGMLDSVLPNTAPRTRTLAATVLFRIPLVRELGLWTGCVDARRSVAEQLLQRGRSILVLPGGEAEQIRTRHGHESVYLRRRKGFLKLAMRHKVPVVPVYVSGVADYYHTSMALFATRLWLVKNLGICIPLNWGLWGSMNCPLPVPTTVVFGKPLTLNVKECSAPTNAELDTAHQQFCEALVQLFDENKDRLGYGDRKLEIV